MPPMTSLDAMTPDEWAYRTLMKRQGPVSAAAPGQMGGVPQQMPYQQQGMPQPQQAPPPVPQAQQPPIVAPGLSKPATAPMGAPAPSPIVRTSAVEDERTPIERPGTTTPPGSGSTQSPYGTTPRTDMGSGRGGGYAYTGFDFDQDANNRLIGKSAKYTFADATREAEAAGAGDVWKTKEGAQYFAEKYIKPKMEAAGVEVLDIRGDKMLLRDWEDRAAGRPGHWVDFVVNAGLDTAQLGWQVDTAGTTGAANEQKYDPRDDASTNPYTTPADPGNQTPGGGEGGSDRDQTEERKRALLARTRENRLLTSLG